MDKETLVAEIKELQAEISELKGMTPKSVEGFNEFRTKYELLNMKMQACQLQFQGVMMVEQLSPPAAQ